MHMYLPQVGLAKNTTHWCLWGTWRQEYQSLVLSLVAAKLKWIIAQLV